MMTPETPPTQPPTSLSPEGGEQATSSIIAPQYGKVLDELTKDFKRLKAQKARPTGGIESRVLLNLSFLVGEQYTHYKNKQLFAEAQDPNKLYLMFNLIRGRFQKVLGRLGSIGATFKATPSREDPKALADAEVVDKLILALDNKLQQKSKMWEILFWMALGGTAFEYTPWIPNDTIEAMPKFSPENEVIFRDLLTGEEVPESVVEQAVQSGARPRETFEVFEEAVRTGDVGSEIFGPLNVFIDQSVKSVEDLAPDQRVYIAKIRTQGWIKENFPDAEVDPDSNFEIVTTTFKQTGDSIGGHFLKDLIPLVQGSTSEDDPKMNVVVESYAPASDTNPAGRYTIFCPGKAVLYDGPNPYKTIPLTDFHWEPVTVTFWTGDYISDLIAPQRFLNKRLSQLGEQANATLYSQVLLGGSLDPSDLNTDSPGAIKNAITDAGAPLVQRLGPPEMPTWYMQSMETVLSLFNEIAGGQDLFQQSKFPGQLRGPMAVPMLQEILDSSWGHLYEHIGERLARVKQLRLDLVRSFYPPIRTLHYTSRNLKDEVLAFHTEEILKKGIDFNIVVERASLLPELRALREARVIERLNSPLSILYIDERTGMLDRSKIAADLQHGDSGRESKEAQYRKLAQEIIDMLWQGQQVPPSLPFYDHAVMMDELESAMATTEFLRASPPIQQLFLARWTEHQQWAQQEAQAQQQAMMQQQIQSAVAQATQQAAAMAAAEAVTSSMGQLQAQGQMVQSGETASLVSNAAGQGGPSGPPARPPLPPNFQ